MLTAGLSTAQQQALTTLLRSSHQITVSLEVLDLNHQGLGSISNQLLSGSVSIDASAEVTRSMTLDLLDVGRSLQLGPDDPDDGAAFPTRMIQCTYRVRDSSVGWISLPVFTGPVSKIDRDGVILRIECLGKESLSQASLWSAKTFAAKWNKGSLIRSMMAVLAGETRFDFEPVTATTAAPTVVQRGENGASVWAWARKIANSIGMQIFYDGRGYLRLRKLPNKPVWTFTENWYVDNPQTTFTLDNVINAVEVTGGTPRGAKKPVSYRAVAPATHPLSPAQLGRGGVPRYLPSIVQNTDLMTSAQAKAYGDTVLANGLLQGVDSTFDALVIPHLEESDLVSLRTDSFASDFRLRQATIPLLCSDTMSIGYQKNVRPARLSRTLRRK